MQTMNIDEVELVAPETLKLIRSAQDGDSEARAEAIKRNMPIVSLALVEMGATGNPDLRQEGVVGLIKAIDGYNLQGHWLAYALKWVKGEVRRARQADGLVRLPADQANAPAHIAATVRLAREELSRDGVDPSLREIAAYIGVDETRVAAIDAANHRSYASIEDVMIALDDPGYEQVEAEQECAAYLGLLDPVERDIVARFFGVDGHAKQTMAEIAASHGMPLTTADGIKRRALSRLHEEVA